MIERISVIYWEPVREEYEFSALQPGRYRLGVTAPGATRAEATIQVKPKMKPVEIVLGRGVTIHTRLKLSQIENVDDELPFVAQYALSPAESGQFIPIAKLFQVGKEIASAAIHDENRNLRFLNIGPGKYQLRILGMEDFAELFPGTLVTQAHKPATLGWKRKELPIEIRADTPDILDAGEIELEKVPLPAR